MVDNNETVLSVFRALGDPSRLAMIERLSRGPANVSELAEPLDMSLAGASKHVGVLEAAGLLVRTKRGRERVCELRPGALFEARDWVQRYSKFWNERLDALEQALEADENE
ncbi:metalloregulator ArsR/SmtB family transcription factor [uncultured Erythrobacter sp.]|uniref:ArsR/SmtB family transcription factor n=1 Tax=uncultured Erythrobacter sp. TaxID=263913 RepID=UPI00260DBDE1|nr:metalloregulator ArsR/SmtB family transcription factor [uncultured Erythrobacter sp.]